MKPSHEAGLCLLEKPRCWSNHFDGNAFCPMCQGGCWRKQVAGGALVHDGSGELPTWKFHRRASDFSNTTPPSFLTAVGAQVEHDAHNHTSPHRKPCIFFGKFEAREHFARSSDGRPRIWPAFAHSHGTHSAQLFLCEGSAILEPGSSDAPCALDRSEYFDHDHQHLLLRARWNDRCNMRILQS